jgi:hypothetical protein
LRVAPIAFDPPKQSGAKADIRLDVNAKTGATTSKLPAEQLLSVPSPPPVASAKSRATVAPAPQSPSVAAAKLCSDLSTSGGGPSIDWRCVPADSPVGPGSLFFYTRLKSSTGTTVQHRWYRDDRLHQVVELPIRVNTAVGYRTYSRSTVNNRGTGDWRVELRSRDGVLLYEERFVVR